MPVHHPDVLTDRPVRVCACVVDIPSSIDYVPESRTKLIAETAKLELCSADCKDPEIDAHISLTTKHIGKGCDRDTYSIQSQRKLCGTLLFTCFI